LQLFYSLYELSDRFPKFDFLSQNFFGKT